LVKSKATVVRLPIRKRVIMLMFGEYRVNCV
jgi:hypothetical protein